MDPTKASGNTGASSVAGDPAALTALAKRFLVGDGVDLACGKGVALLQEADSRGNAEAAAQLAVCASWGIGQPRDIDGALDYLERAAARGSMQALRELQLLARSQNADAAVLRRSIDVAALSRPPAARVLRDRPLMLAIQGFATAEECRWLIERGRPGLRPARVYRKSATPQESETRTNTEADFTIFRADVLQSLLRDRIAAAARAPTSHFEVAKLLHYAPGEQFALHADFVEPRTPELAREIQLRGQRAATFLLYLNDSYEGGATAFPRLNVSFKGRCGDALLFTNIDPAGAPDHDTVHAGMPPVSGEKWLLSQWIRSKPISA